MGNDLNREFTFIPDLSAQLPDIPPDSIISRTFFSTKEVKAILFGFAAGQELSEHTSAKNAILHFLEGQVELSLGDEKFLAEAGAWVYLPPHLSHSILAKTNVTMLLFMY